MALEKQEPSRFRPFRMVAMVVTAYLILCGAYIWVSDWVAARAAQSVVQLEWIERVKGIAFIFISAAGLFAFLWMLLSRIFSQQRELLHQRNALMLSERRAVAGLFASSVAHDINNILMVLRFDLEELANASELTPEHHHLIEQIAPAVNDLSVLAKRLSALGKHAMPGGFDAIDLIEVARETVSFVRTHDAVRKCTLVLSGDESLVMEANATAIRQMLVNLVLNAAEASDGKGYIEVKIRKLEGDAVIEVHDDGPGIAFQNRGAIFTSLYSSKGDMSGLGLLSVKVYAEAHQGQVEIGSSYLGGACFRIILPLLREPNHNSTPQTAGKWRELWAIR